MGLEVRNRGWNGLIRWPWMEFLWLSLASRASVTVHVVGSEMVVLDPNGLPLGIDEGEQNDRVAVDRPA